MFIAIGKELYIRSLSVHVFISYWLLTRKSSGSQNILETRVLLSVAQFEVKKIKVTGSCELLIKWYGLWVDR